MIQAPLFGWILFAAAFALSSVAGISLAARAAWSSQARSAGLPTAFGLAVAPLLLGLCAVAVLTILPGSPHAVHMAGMGCLCLALCGLFSGKRPNSAPTEPAATAGMSSWQRLLQTLLIVLGALLVANALFFPFLQNDALEYALAGRRLFLVRDIAAYPAVDAVGDPSGFYGPWTHPPLYPAMIYLAYAFQGHAETPGLMRLISPWLLLVAANLVAALGRLNDRTTGLIAALFVLTTPLLFLGAGSALIDVMPVLGLALVLSSIVGLEGTSARTGMVQGMTLGVALWTHSQAVLFAPLYIAAVVSQKGLRRDVIRQATISLTVAVVVAFWPYARNYARIGSIISDNPLVFAMPELDWAGYFRGARGIDYWPEKIQYGILKGWFAFEAYALSFWFLLPGLVPLAWRRNRSEERQRRQLAPAAMLLCYLAGVSLSVVLGIDLMIKTERYMLVILPCVALLAGFGVSRWVSRAGYGSYIVKIGVTLLFVAQTFVIGGYLMRDLGYSPGRLLQSEPKKLALWPPWDAILYLRERTPPSSLILTLKPSDLYFAHRKMVSFLDPRLMPFYREKDPAAGAVLLRGLGVTHIHVPDYALPPLYNSVLMPMLGRPDLTSLVFSKGGYQIYELSSETGSLGHEIDLSPRVSAWTRSQGFVLGGRKRLSRFSTSSQPLTPDAFSAPETRLPFFRRDWSMRMDSPALDLPTDSLSQEYRLELTLEGRGFAQIYLTYLANDSTQVSEEALGGTLLSGKDANRLFTRRFIVPPNVSSIRVGVEHRGPTKLRVNRAMLTPVIK